MAEGPCRADRTEGGGAWQSVGRALRRGRLDAAVWRGIPRCIAAAVHWPSLHSKRPDAIKSSDRDGEKLGTFLVDAETTFWHDPWSIRETAC